MTTTSPSAQERKNTSLNLNVAPLSGIIEVSVSHPIDTLKTKTQQLMFANKTATFRTSIHEIYSIGGFAGFYKGYQPRVIGIMPMRLIYWGTMSYMNEYVKAPQFTYIEKIILPGLFTGLIQSLVDNPIEVMKTRLMTGAAGTIPSLQSLSKGIFPTTLRNIVFAIPVSACVYEFGQKHPFLAGACGGLIGSIISQPLDVIKTEMQRHKVGEMDKSAMSILNEIIRQRMSNLFSGLKMRALLSVVNMGVGFLAYDSIYTLTSRCFPNGIIFQGGGFSLPESNGYDVHSVHPVTSIQEPGSIVDRFDPP